MPGADGATIFYGTVTYDEDNNPSGAEPDPALGQDGDVFLLLNTLIGITFRIKGSGAPAGTRPFP